MRNSVFKVLTGYRGCLPWLVLAAFVQPVLLASGYYIPPRARPPRPAASEKDKSRDKSREKPGPAATKDRKPPVEQRQDAVRAARGSAQ